MADKNTFFLHTLTHLLFKWLVEGRCREPDKEANLACDVTMSFDVDGENPRRREMTLHISGKVAAALPAVELDEGKTIGSTATADEVATGIDAVDIAELEA